MGNKKCEHGRVRYSCKDCGGSGICEHGRRRTVCKDCGGGSICEHGRRRSTCRDCGGGGPVTFLEATEVEEFDGEEAVGPYGASTRGRCTARWKAQALALAHAIPIWDELRTWAELHGCCARVSLAAALLSQHIDGVARGG